MNNNNIICIIPARMGSSRFPGKPMKLIQGIPMIGYVYNKVRENIKISKTIVATCDSEIESYINSIQGEVVMTSSSHDRASDRCSEALSIIENKLETKFDIVLMIQGDEPLISSKMIDDALEPLIENKSINVVNLKARILSKKEFDDPNCIKVVTDKNNNAIYFSRQSIPTMKDYNNDAFKQVCVIPFRREFLISYNKMKPTKLEELESIDMLRIIENGFSVYMSETKEISFSVDTEEDLIKVNEYISNNA